MELGIFTFNDFAENTYVLYDETKECIIIDPGCSNSKEEEILDSFLKAQNLKPIRLINTHCHIDHVLGNKHISNKYDLELEAHKGEIPVLESCKMVSQMYGIAYEKSPKISKFIEEGDAITFGNTTLKTLFTPGHSPASISLYCEENAVLIVGDVLFQGSIGRTDLPGGDYETLLNAVRTKLFTLPDDTSVFPGHGPATKIGIERATNPFFN